MYPAVMYPWTLGLWLVDGGRCARESKRGIFSSLLVNGRTTVKANVGLEGPTRRWHKRNTKRSVGSYGGPVDPREWPGGHDGLPRGDVMSVDPWAAARTACLRLAESTRAEFFFSLDS